MRCEAGSGGVMGLSKIDNARDYLEGRREGFLVHGGREGGCG